MSKELLAGLQIAEGFIPVDMSAAANDGDWVSLENFRSCLVVLYKAVGTAGQDPTLTIEQATSAAGGGAKALNFTRVHSKQAATNLQGTGQFTKVEQAAANTYTHTDGAEQAALWVVEIQSDDLDKANDFKFIRGRVADVGAAAQLGSLLYILGNPRYETAPENAPSVLA